ncbi:MAG: phosphatidylinositol kinase, partial [Alcanivorax sp.]|nr:phosphatidylinositol kinase [Alcanivorax sp.]
MTFKPVRKLTVTRTLATGQAVTVGVLAQNRQGVFFQYDADYLGRFGNLSPFGLKATTELQLAPKRPHSGLHGLFGDSLPDGWGSLLQDRVFRQHGILPAQITAMDRLAFVGASGMGALSFSPTSEYQLASTGDIDLAKLGLEAQAFFDG